MVGACGGDGWTRRRRGIAAALYRSLDRDPGRDRRLRDGGNPSHTILAALMAELMPRLIGAYGSHRVISVLTDLAAHIAIDAATRH
jgi:hypothetical protein